jgi:hypothetical protein
MQHRRRLSRGRAAGAALAALLAVFLLQALAGGPAHAGGGPEAPAGKGTAAAERKAGDHGPEGGHEELFTAPCRLAG